MSTPTDGRAVRHMSRSPGSPTPLPPKTFDDATAYTTDIRRVVPGYDLIRETALCTLAVGLPRRGRLRIVGCGPGDELVAVAHTLPGWEIDAIEPSPAMHAAAVAAVGAAGLGHRITVRCISGAEAGAPPCDAVLCLLVTHLLGGRDRRDVWAALADGLRPGGWLLHAEIEAMTPSLRTIWTAWAAHAGCTAERVTTLAARLDGGFPLRSSAETRALATTAGLSHRGELVRVLGVVLHHWERS